jgi:glycosyltransferase involved in cell wall biosynthesis
MPTLHFLVPGDPATRTGGFIYDRRIVQSLRQQGWTVTVHVLTGDFPEANVATRDRAGRLFASLPADTLLVIDGLALAALSDRLGEFTDVLRLVALVHHPVALETGLTMTQQQRLRDRETRALAHIRRVIVTSAATAHLLPDYGVTPDRLVVVPPGTDPAPLASGSGGGTLNLFCAATLTPRKGHAVLFEALATLTNRAWTLDCAGSLARDPMTVAALRRQLAVLGLSERVRLLGELDDAGLTTGYDRADVFVLPSWFEGYGMVLAEALARGLPVISTQAGAIPDTVPPTAGLLVPPGDSQALRVALAWILDDRDLRERLAAGARAIRETLPDWHAAGTAFAVALQPVLAA